MRGYVEEVFISWSLVSMDYVCFKLFALVLEKKLSSRVVLLGHVCVQRAKHQGTRDSD